MSLIWRGYPPLNQIFYLVLTACNVSPYAYHNEYPGLDSRYVLTASLRPIPIHCCMFEERKLSYEPRLRTIRAGELVLAIRATIADREAWTNAAFYANTIGMRTAA